MQQEDKNDGVSLASVSAPRASFSAEKYVAPTTINMNIQGKNHALRKSKSSGILIEYV